MSLEGRRRAYGQQKKRKFFRLPHAPALRQMRNRHCSSPDLPRIRKMLSVIFAIIHGKIKNQREKNTMTGRDSRALNTCSILARCCILGILLMSTPLYGQSDQVSPAEQKPAIEPSTGVMSPSLVEGPARKSPEPFVSREKVAEALLKANFVYNQNKMVDPFVSFLSPGPSAPPELPAAVEDEVEPPPEPQRPLTPLQKMSLGEIERGLKAIVWGEYGRRALIEDSAGKGYIVGIGTPVGERNGVITDIFNDRIVIQQESWDRTAKRFMPDNFSVKLKKEQAK
jgi:Tfp pilus assembly protein PilP